MQATASSRAACSSSASPVVIALNKRRPAERRTHRHANGDRVETWRLLRAASHQRQDRRRRARSSATISSRFRPKWPLYFPQEQRTDCRSRMQIAGARARAGAAVDARRSAARDHGRGPGAGRARDRGEILVETDSQKQILVGKGVSMVRRSVAAPGRRSRRSPCGHPVYLEPGVKVKARWRRDEALLQRLGLLIRYRNRGYNSRADGD